MFAPILPQLLINLHEIRVGNLHGLSVGSQRNRCSALGIRHEQRPGFVHTITPLRDIIAVKSAVSLIGGILLDEFTLASHALLSILPGVIKVGNIHQHTNQCTRSTYGCGLHKLLHGLLSDSIDQISNNHKEDDEQIIIGHLHMIGINFKGCKDCRDNEPP